MIKELGADKVTVTLDVVQSKAMPSGYKVFIDGERTATGAEAMEWAEKISGYGVRTILPTKQIRRRRSERF